MIKKENNRRKMKNILEREEHDDIYDKLKKEHHFYLKQ